MLRSFYIALINIIVCCFFSYQIAPFVKKIGTKYKIVDIPNIRKIHTKPIVRIGGLSIFIIFFFYFFLYRIFFDFSSLNPDNIYSLSVILIGALIFFVIGLHDDIFKSSPFLRLSLQFGIAFLVSKCGINFGSLNFFIPYFGQVNMVLPDYVNLIFSSFWIVGITNAINWIDGIDALAAGFSSILSIGLCLLMVIMQLLL